MTLQNMCAIRGRHVPQSRGVICACSQHHSTFSITGKSECKKPRHKKTSPIPAAKINKMAHNHIQEIGRKKIRGFVWSSRIEINTKRNRPNLFCFALPKTLAPSILTSQGRRRSNLHWAPLNISVLSYYTYYLSAAPLPSNSQIAQCTGTKLERTVTGNAFRQTPVTY